MDITYYKKYEPIFGSWHIVREIGEGSFGKVFEIEREDFGVTYKAALKAITIPQNQSELKNAMLEFEDDADSVTSYFEGFVEDTVTEFALMARLKGNSNIVGYEDHAVYKHSDGIGWDILIRMELLTPILDYVRANSLTRETVIGLGVDICKALEHCGKVNIIHRDIKPENVFVSEFGDFKLGDFGVARVAEKTMGGMSKKGTYNYMAPEVYKGEEYGASVDTYSLGLMLHRFLNNNRSPFLPQPPTPIKLADREAALARRLKGEAIPAPVNADDELAKIILKACAYDPKDRYSSPAEMRKALEAAAKNTEATIAEQPAEEDEDKTVGIFSGAAMATAEINPSEAVTVPEVPVEKIKEDITGEETVVEAPLENGDETVGIFGGVISRTDENGAVADTSTELADSDSVHEEEPESNQTEETSVSAGARPRLRRAIIAAAITAGYTVFGFPCYLANIIGMTSIIITLLITFAGLILFRPKNAKQFFAVLGMEVISCIISIGLALICFKIDNSHAAAVMTLLSIIIAVTLIPILIIEFAIRAKQKKEFEEEDGANRKKFRKTLIWTVVLDILLSAVLFVIVASGENAKFYEYYHDANGYITYICDRNFLTNNSENSYSCFYEYNSNAENGIYDYYTMNRYPYSGTVFDSHGKKVLKYSVNSCNVWSDGIWCYESSYSRGHNGIDVNEWFEAKIAEYCERLGIERDCMSSFDEVFDRDTGEILMYILEYYEPGTDDHVTRKYDSSGNLMYTYRSNWHDDYVELHYDGEGNLIYEESGDYDSNIKVKVSLNDEGGFPLRIEVHNYEVLK